MSTRLAGVRPLRLHRASWLEKHVTTKRTMVLSTVIGTVILLLLRDPAPVFVYDAAQYWDGAAAVVTGGHVYVLGGLGARGVFTSLVYVPAAAVVELLGLTMEGATWAVLIQNSLIISALGALVIPLMLRCFVNVRPAHVLWSATMTVLMLSGFAPYPVMDVPALAAMFLGLLLVAHRRWWLLAAGGALLAVAVNLRPAFLLPVLLVLVLLLVHRRMLALVAVVGTLAPLALQAWYGWRVTGLLTPWPPGTAIVTAIQLNYSSYGVRYDTIPYVAGDPRQWYCSPEMAAHAVNGLPATTGDLLGVFVSNLPESAFFAIEKVAATLQWSWTTPYSGTGRESMQLMGVVACLIAAMGVVALVVLQTSAIADRFLPRAIAVSVLGCAVVIVGSAPESRFAAPMVIGGVVGVCAAGPLLARRDRVTLVALLSALIIAGVTWAAGVHGMSHPAPRGDITAERCLTLASSAAEVDRASREERLVR